jgi:hypothetical protein
VCNLGVFNLIYHIVCIQRVVREVHYVVKHQTYSPRRHVTQFFHNLRVVSMSYAPLTRKRRRCVCFRSYSVASSCLSASSPSIRAVIRVKDSSMSGFGSSKGEGLQDDNMFSQALTQCVLRKRQENICHCKVSGVVRLLTTLKLHCVQNSRLLLAFIRGMTTTQRAGTSLCRPV